MKTIFFPSQYKRALLSRKKSVTIRIKEEIERYSVGKTYSAKSYSGKEWNIEIKILDIRKAKLGELTNLGIPPRTIKSIQNREEVSLNENVELINFEVL